MRAMCTSELKQEYKRLMEQIDEQDDLIDARDDDSKMYESLTELANLYKRAAEIATELGSETYTLRKNAERIAKQAEGWKE